MDDRFALRFESGERQGDLIPIVSGRLTIGRRPGNGLQILDASVSGKHAELREEDGTVIVKDLGSTNGTRVGGQRVIEAQVAHGDTVHVGNVRMTFLDRTLEEGAAAPAAPAAPSVPASRPAAQAATAAASAPASRPQAAAGTLAEDGGSRVTAVSAERLARSRSRSLVGLLGLVVLLAGGGAAWWFLRTKDSGGTRTQPVVPVAGNLLADGYSFEDGADGGWRSDDRATAGFFASPSARGSGEVGLEAELVAGEWALHASPWVRTAPGKRLTARAAASVEGELSAALGIELAGPEPPPEPDPDAEDEDDGAREARLGPGRSLARAALAEDDERGEVEIAVDVPPGYERARVVLRADAWGEGIAAFDDVSLVASAGGAQPALRSGDVELWELGEPTAELCVCDLSGPIVTGLEVHAPIAARGPEEDASAVDARRTATLALEALPTGATVRVDGLPGGPARLELFAETRFADVGVATIGEGGYRTHATGFEREGTTSLLVGAGRELVRLGFAQPVTARGEALGDRVRLTVELGGERSFELQLDFADERKRAEDLAHEARKAERDGDLGACVARWAELLDRYPYEAGLVEEAEAARGRLVEAGMAEVRAVRDDVERARFFRLADLFRECRSAAVALAERYAPSEVEAAAYEVVATLDAELDGLAGGGSDERERLESIARGLEASGSEALAQRVRGYVRDRLPEPRDTGNDGGEER